MHRGTAFTDSPDIGAAATGNGEQVGAGRALFLTRTLGGAQVLEERCHGAGLGDVLNRAFELVDRVAPFPGYERRVAAWVCRDLEWRRKVMLTSATTDDTEW